MTQTYYSITATVVLALVLQLVLVTGVLAREPRTPSEPRTPVVPTVPTAPASPAEPTAPANPRTPEGGSHFCDGLDGIAIDLPSLCQHVEDPGEGDDDGNSDDDSKDDDEDSTDDNDGEDGNDGNEGEGGEGGEGGDGQDGSDGGQGEDGGDGSDGTDGEDGPIDEGDPVIDPLVDHILITEVMYDLAQDGTQGSEQGGDNEWVEIMNVTGEDVDLNGWSIGDGLNNDVLATEEFILEFGERLVITDSQTTADFWDFTDVKVIYLGSSISGGLANAGDSVILFDDTDTAVDGVSYGDSNLAFSPSVADVGPGSSIERRPVNNDTDSADDWQENADPDPGS